MLSIRNTFARSGEMSNASNLLLVFSCSVIIKAESDTERRLNTARTVCGRICDSHQTQKITLQQVVLCLGATCLAALFGIQQQPGSSASSLSMGPQHLFPLLCRNFLYLARSWTPSICVQVTVCNSLRAINSIISKVMFLFSLLFLCCCSCFFQMTVVENMIQLGRTTKHFSPGLLNVMSSLCMLLTHCVARSENYLSFSEATGRNKERVQS